MPPSSTTSGVSLDSDLSRLSIRPSLGFNAITTAEQYTDLLAQEWERESRISSPKPDYLENDRYFSWNSRVKLVNQILAFAFGNFDANSRTQLVLGAVNLLDRILCAKIEDLSDENELRLIGGAAVTLTAKWVDTRVGDKVWTLMKESLGVDNEELKAVELDALSVLRGELCHSHAVTWLDLILPGLRSGGTISTLDMNKTSALAHYILLSSTLHHKLVGQPCSKVVAASVCFALRVQDIKDWDVRTTYPGNYTAEDLIPVYAELFKGITQPHTGSKLQDCYEVEGLKRVVACVDKWCQRTMAAKLPKKAASMAI